MKNILTFFYNKNFLSWEKKKSLCKLAQGNCQPRLNFESITPSQRKNNIKYLKKNKNKQHECVQLY